MAAIYLWLAPKWSGFLQPIDSISAPFATLLQVAGAAGLWGVAGVASLLIGETVCTISWQLLIERPGRRILTYQLRDFSTETALVDRLMERGPLGRYASAYSITSLRRVYRRLAVTKAFSTLTPEQKSYRFRAIMHSVLYMAPRLMEIRPETYAEQQRLRADAELRVGLVIVLPALAWAVGENLRQPPSWLMITIPALGMAWSLYLLWDAFRLWRESNSQIAHGVCDSRTTLGYIVNRPLSKYETDYRSLPEWARRLHDLASIR